MPCFPAVSVTVKRKSR